MLWLGALPEQLGGGLGGTRLVGHDVEGFIGLQAVGRELFVPFGLRTELALDPGDFIEVGVDGFLLCGCVEQTPHQPVLAVLLQNDFLVWLGGGVEFDLGNGSRRQLAVHQRLQVGLLAEFGLIDLFLALQVRQAAQQGENDDKGQQSFDTHESMLRSSVFG